ncbi:MAG TPA: (Fe-S)-binding protein [Dehalococcoidales bacterium]|nr:(Fe-S)-binding protein [Dehalococcoidales bacterium]
MDSHHLSNVIKETKIRLCLDCGKCTTFCPVNSYNSDFNPRRMIQKTVNSNNTNPQDELIWSCLNCLACQQFCNYSVKFPEFMTAVRAEAASQGVKVQCSHGGALQSMMHMMAAGRTTQKRLDWLPVDVKLVPDSETIFFVGCAPYFDVLFQDLGVRTLGGVIGALRLLNRSGIAFRLMENERCCGRDLLLQGDVSGFRKLAEANQSEFKRQGVKRIITYCPECLVCLKKDYPAALGNQDIQVVNLVELLAPLAQEKKLKLSGFKKKVTFHDPCTLGRGAGLYEEPRQLLKSMDGLDLLEMESNRERALCCGASPWAACNSVNRQIQGKRLAQAEAAAEMLVTACPKCQIHFKCAQKGLENPVSQIEVKDLAELLSADHQ